MSTFLSKEEIQELTGYRQLGKQCQQLAIMGIEFVTGKNGEPKVLRAAIEQRLGARPPAQKKKQKEPDFTSLRRAS